MVALEVTSGQRLWEQNLAGISTPAVAGEWLFVVTDDARLLCVARGSGKVRWMHQLPRYQNEKKKKGPILGRPGARRQSPGARQLRRPAGLCLARGRHRQRHRGGFQRPDRSVADRRQLDPLPAR